MDAVSYSLASKQAQRIEKFIENPDSTSGIVTVPKVITSGETITIPAGRVAVLPNVQVDGTLNVDGEVFVPSGATFGGFGDLDAKIALKADTSYVNSKLGLKADTSYVNSQLGLKADTSYVNSQLGLIKQNVLVANDAAVKTALNATGTAPIYACRAWVNFNGTGTIAIRASGNVSSITDNGVGHYSVNFINPMIDSDYVAIAKASDITANIIVDHCINYSRTPSTAVFKASGGASTFQPVDRNNVLVSIFR